MLVLICILSSMSILPIQKHNGMIIYAILSFMLLMKFLMTILILIKILFIEPQMSSVRPM